MAKYVALLRGINVGGNNLIKMADLAACFTGGGFANVSTYIASGNVLFEAPAAGAAKLVAKIEAMLAARFDYAASVAIRSEQQLRAVIDEAPKGFGKQPDRYRYDVLFLKPPLTGAAAAAQVPSKDGVDAVHPGPGVVYASRLIARATQSHINKLAASPIYKRVTIRNWNTTTKLLALMERAG